MSEENVETVREVFDAWNRRDYETVQAALDPQIEIEFSFESNMDGIYRGDEGLAQVMQFWAAFDDFRSELQEPRGGADSVVARVHHFGRGKGSGVEVEMENWQVFTLRDGKLVRYGVYGSERRALEAAGLSK